MVQTDFAYPLADAESGKKLQIVYIQRRVSGEAGKKIK
jgi:hypothetical protein